MFGLDVSDSRVNRNVWKHCDCPGCMGVSLVLHQGKICSIESLCTLAACCLPSFAHNDVMQALEIQQSKLQTCFTTVVPCTNMLKRLLLMLTVYACCNMLLCRSLMVKH